MLNFCNWIKESEFEFTLLLLRKHAAQKRMTMASRIPWLAGALLLCDNVVYAQPLAVVYEYAAQPGMRPAFVMYVASTIAPQFSAWQASNLITGYSLRTSTFSGSAWDAQACLYFADGAALSAWKSIEATYSGGLTLDAITNIATVTASYVADSVVVSAASRPTNPSLNSTTTVTAFSLLSNTSIADFRNFAASYVQPLYNTVLASGVISRFEVHHNVLSSPDGASGAGWDALLVSEFVDAAAMVGASNSLAAARATLSTDSAWAAWAAAESTVWTSTLVTVADWVIIPAPQPYSSFPPSIAIVSMPALQVTLGMLLIPIVAIMLVAAVTIGTRRYLRRRQARTQLGKYKLSYDT